MEIKEIVKQEIPPRSQAKILQQWLKMKTGKTYGTNLMTSKKRLLVAQKVREVMKAEKQKANDKGADKGAIGQDGAGETKNKGVSNKSSTSTPKRNKKSKGGKD